MEPEVVAIDPDGADPQQLVVHDESAAHAGLAFFLSQFDTADLPVPLWVFRSVSAPTCDELNAQLHDGARAKKGRGDLAELLHSGDTWTIG